MYWIVDREVLLSYLPIATEIVTNIGSMESRIVKLQVLDGVMYLIGARHDAFFRLVINVENDKPENGDFFIDLYDFIHVVEKIETEKLVFKVKDENLYLELFESFFFFDTYNMADTFLNKHLSEDINFKKFRLQAEVDEKHPLIFPMMNKLLSLSIKDSDKKVYVRGDRAYFQFTTIRGGRIHNVDFCDSILDLTILKIMSQLHGTYSFQFWESDEDYMISFGESYLVFAKTIEDVGYSLNVIDEKLDSIKYIKADTERFKKLASLYDFINNLVDAEVYTRKGDLWVKFHSRRKEPTTYKIGKVEDESKVSFEVPVRTLNNILSLCPDMWDVGIVGATNTEGERSRFIKLGDKIEFII